MKNRFLLLLILGIAASFAANYQIEVYNPNSYELTDFQVLLDVSNITPDYTTLNITEPAISSASLPYCWVQQNDYLETVCGPTYAGIDKIWVKVPSLPPATTTILFVTTGGSATTADQVFLLYDDVENTANWNVLGGIQFNTANPYEGATAIRKTNNNQNTGAIRNLPTTITNEDTVLEFWTYGNSGNPPIERVGLYDSVSATGVGYYLDIRGGGRFIGIDDYNAGTLTPLTTTATTRILNQYNPNRFYMWNKLNNTYEAVSYDSTGTILGQISLQTPSYDNFNTLYFFGRRDYYGDVFTIRKIAPLQLTYYVQQSQGFYWNSPTDGEIFVSSPQNFSLIVFDPTLQNCYSLLDNNTILNGISITGTGEYNISTSLVLGSQDYNVWCDDGGALTYYSESRNITYDNSPPQIDSIVVSYDNTAPEKVYVDVYVSETITAVDDVIVQLDQLNQNQTATNTGLFYRATFNMILNDGDTITGTVYVNDTAGWKTSENYSYTYTQSSSISEWSNYSFDGTLVVNITNPPKNTVIPFKAYLLEYTITNLYDSNPHPAICKFYIGYSFDFTVKYKVYQEEFYMDSTTVTRKTRIPTELSFQDGAGNYIRDMPPQQQVTVVCGLTDVKKAGYDTAEYQTYKIAGLSIGVFLLTSLVIVLGSIFFLYSDWGVLVALAVQILNMFVVLMFSADGVSQSWFLVYMLQFSYIFANFLFIFSIIKLAFETKEEYLKGM